MLDVSAEERALTIQGEEQGSAAAPVPARIRQIVTRNLSESPTGKPMRLYMLSLSNRRHCTWEFEAWCQRCNPLCIRQEGNLRSLKLRQRSLIRSQGLRIEHIGTILVIKRRPSTSSINHNQDDNINGFSSSNPFGGYLLGLMEHVASQ